MKKRFSFILILALVMALVAACSGGNNSPNNTGNTGGNGGNTGGTGQTQNQGDEDQSPPREPVTLSALVQNHPAYPFREDWMIWDVYKDHLNVTLEVSGYQGNWWETIPLVIGSGDLPDFMWMSGTDNFHKYGNEGALVDLNEHLDKMPNLKKFIEEHPAETAVMLSADGKLYIPPSKGAFAASTSIFMYRADVFEANGLNPPDNYEALREALRTLKQAYPDSYPLMVNQLNNMVYGFAAGFGTGDGYYYNSTKDAMAYGPMEDGFRDMVQFFSELYAERLIPIDFLTIDSNQLSQMLTTGRSFVYFGYVNNIDTNNSSGQETNPDYLMKAMIPPEGPGGRYGGTQSFLTQGLAITTTTKKLDDALALLDWTYSDEAMEALSWGIEGVSYEVVNGEKKFVDAITDQTAMTRDFGIRSSGNFHRFDENAWKSLMSEEAAEAQDIALEYMRPMKPNPALTADEQDAIGIKSDAIGKYYQENVSKFIMGQRPMSEWDDYVKGLIELGAEDVLAVWQGAYERQQAQLGQ